MAKLKKPEHPMFSNRQLANLIIPLFFEQLLALCIGLADTVMVAGVGEAAISGISTVDTVNVILINLFSALATGGAVVTAQYIGRRDYLKAGDTAAQLMYSVLAIALVVMTFTLIGNGWILKTVFGRLEQDVMENAKIYFFLSALSYPFLGMYNAGAALFRAQGNSRISLITSLLMNAANITGNAILIYGFGMGVAGAGIASLFARILSGVIMLVLLCGRKNPVRIRHFFRPRLDFSLIKMILHIGIPNGIENSIFQVGKLIVQGLVTSFGTVAIAANAVSNSICGLQSITGGAVNMAMITVIGQCAGARDFDQLRYYNHRLMSFACLSMAAVNSVGIFLVDDILKIYHLTPETALLAKQLIILSAAFCFFVWPIAFVLPTSLRAVGDVRFTMITSAISMWVCRVAFSYVFGRFLGLGLVGVSLAMILDWIVRAIVFTIRFRSNKWEKNQLIHD